MGALLSSQEVAKHYNVSQRAVAYATKKGELKGTKVGWGWVYPQALLPKEWPVKRKKR